MSNSNREVEIKLKLTRSLAETRKQLRELGFQVVKPRVFESNVVLDTAESSLRAEQQLIRLRRAGKKKTLTYKGSPKPGRHKSREEIETEVEDADNLEKIFGRLGYVPVFRYEKYRTEFQEGPNEGTVTLDETPIGDFLELEGKARWIDRTAKRLGYKQSDYITQSYGALYLNSAGEQGRSAGNMLFS